MRLYFIPCPKSVKPAKAKPKPIPTKSKFKSHNNDPTKSYKKKRTEAEVLAYAQVCRQTRLSNPTPAESAFADILLSMGIAFEREAIFVNGDRHILCDFVIRTTAGASVCIEVDGRIHSAQSGYDRGRDKWMFERYGVRTIRFTNREVLANEGAEVHDRLLPILSPT